MTKTFAWFSIALFAIVPASTQQITLDWASSDRSLVCPSETSHQNNLPLIISNVNDVLYTYIVETSVAVTTPDDYSQLPKLSEAARSGCEGTLDNASNDYTAIANKMKSDASITPGSTAGTISSVKLADTIKAWNTIKAMPQFASLADEVKTLQACPKFGSDQDEQNRKIVLDGYDKLQSFQDKINGPHQWKGSVPLTVGATNSVTVTITEQYGDQVVKSPVTAKCDIKSSVLSLSAGPLFSTIAARDYASVAVPGGPGQPATVNELIVQDNSNLQPLLVGLLNYDLPLLHWNWVSGDEFGFQVSSGPTFRIGGPNNTSSFGYFGGLSIHAWKRFFATPGVHVAEFADFPAGFTAGSIIPSGFTLTPIKRWKAGFGFSISYRTNSLSTLGQKNTSPSSVAPAQPQNSKPAPQNTANPIPNTNPNSGVTPPPGSPGSNPGTSPSGNPGSRGSAPPPKF